MKITFSNKPFGEIGIVGHVGCGHANSHCGFIQDDSAGLAAVLSLLERATALDLTIVKVTTEVGKKGSFTVQTASGGLGSSSPRRGITQPEARLAQWVVGQKVICTQSLVVQAFGRVLGQGAMEVPVALQTAIANAALDSFAKNFPKQCTLVKEDVLGNVGNILGTTLSIDGIDTSVLAVVNATEGGLGPNEDLEGNVNLGQKGELMARLRLDRLPTILLEGKVCANPTSSQINKDTFLIRAFPESDNPVVAQALYQSAQSLNLPAIYDASLLGRSPDAMRNLTQTMGEKVVALGHALSLATTSQEKVRLVGELNVLISEDLGGVTFMSDEVHQIMGGVGMIPGLCGCMSLFISHESLNEVVLPQLSESEATQYVDIIVKAVASLHDKREEALQYVKGSF